MTRRISFPDLWHLEKAITAAAMMAAVIVILASYVMIGDHLGWLVASLFALAALLAVAWIIIRFIPLSEYRRRSR
jgi:hypothetical protein